MAKLCDVLRFCFAENMQLSPSLTRKPGIGDSFQFQLLYVRIYGCGGSSADLICGIKARRILLVLRRSVILRASATLSMPSVVLYNFLGKETGPDETVMCDRCEKSGPKVA